MGSNKSINILATKSNLNHNNNKKKTNHVDRASIKLRT